MDLARAAESGGLRAVDRDCRLEHCAATLGGARKPRPRCRHEGFTFAADAGMLAGSQRPALCGSPAAPHIPVTRVGLEMPRVARADRRRSCMSRVCQVTGKKAMVGNRVSHANNKTKRRFEVNLQTKRYWLEQEKRWITLRLSTSAMKVINKRGLTA